MQFPLLRRTRVGRANAAARVEPERTSYFNAIQQYAYTDGVLFQIYTAPGQITDIMLQEGEELVDRGRLHRAIQSAGSSATR